MVILMGDGILKMARLMGTSAEDMKMKPNS